MKAQIKSKVKRKASVKLKTSYWIFLKALSVLAPFTFLRCNAVNNKLFKNIFPF